MTHNEKRFHSGAVSVMPSGVAQSFVSNELSEGEVTHGNLMYLEESGASVYVFILQILSIGHLVVVGRSRDPCFNLLSYNLSSSQETRSL